MRAVREGDLAQLGVLFERHAGGLFDFLSRMTGNRTAAEDLVQDVFVRMLKYRATFRDDGRFETWVAGLRAVLARQVKAIEEELPSARVVQLSDANHYVFLSNEADVLREIRAFLARLG